MIEGTYRFYQEGELLLESKNLITTEGGLAILKYLGGKVRTIGEAIALGSGSVAPTVDDKRLTFEVGRASVLVHSVDEENSSIIFKTTIPQFEEYTIHEVGIWNLFSAPGVGAGGRTISLFAPFEGWTNATSATTNVRASREGILVSAGANATVSTRSDSSVLDLSNYSANDEFLLAFHKANNNVTDLSLVFENALTGAKFSLQKTVTALPVGYNVVSFKKGDFTLTGTLDWSEIDRFGVDVKAGGTAGAVTLDGIRLEDSDLTDTDYTLISRSVLATPLVKTNVASMDVEYAMRFNIG